MCIKTVPLDSFQCDKWIAVRDILLDFTLKDYDHFQFNNLYIMHRSGNNDGVFGVYRPRRNTYGNWSRADLIGFTFDYGELLTFIDIRAIFINLRTDEKININREVKQKVLIFFPSHTPMQTAVTCLYLKHHNHRYSVTDEVPF